MPWVVTALGGAALLGGLAIAGLGAAALRQWYRLYRRQPVDVHQVVPGPTETAGTARPLEGHGTVRSPLTGTECLLYEHDVEEETNSQHGSSWSSVESGTGGVSFVVEDGTGQVLVDPEHAKTVLDEEFAHTLDGGDEPSGQLASFLERSDVDHDSGVIDVGITELSYGDRHRFRERRLHPGDSVYVAGRADRGVGDYDVEFGGPDFVIRQRARSGGRVQRFLEYPFVISDYPEGTAQRKLLWNALQTLAIGLPVTLLGGYLLLAALA